MSAQLSHVVLFKTALNAQGDVLILDLTFLTYFKLA